jgi:hypothetical protein
MIEKEIFEKYPKMFPNSSTTMGLGLEVPLSWLPTINELCNALQNRGWTWGGGPRSRPQVIADQIKTKFGQLRFYFHLENTDETWEEQVTEEERKEAFRKYYDYYQGMIDFADNMLYNMEYENGKPKDNKKD